MDEPSDPSASDEPDATAGELARRCSLCHGEIGGEFFLLRGSSVCPGCAQTLEQRRTDRGHRRRGLLFGAAAAAGTALVWYGLTQATSRPLVGFAVVVGVAVGLAMQRASGGRGGWRYQIAAAMLVYGAFVVRYVPPIFGGIADAIKREHAGSVGELPATTSRVTATATSTSAEVPAVAPQTSVLATIEAYFVFTAIAWGLVLASPFTPGTTGLLPLLSLAAGMAVAVGLNRRVRLRGPYAGAGPE